MIFAQRVEALEVNVTVSESVVRSAPFDVAPEIGRVHAGDRLSGRDQPAGEWRVVKLPDGRSGYLRERDVTVALHPVSDAVPSSEPPAVRSSAERPIEATTTPEGGSAKPQNQPAPERGASVGVWVVPWASHHFQGAGWEHGGYYRWFATQLRAGILQNAYEPISGTPLLTLNRTQRLLVELEFDARWRFSRLQTLAAGAGVSVMDDALNTTSMNALEWTTETKDQWHVRPLLGLSLTVATVRMTTTVYLESNPEAFVSFGMYWGRR
jgi:hypothetical protein